MRLLITKGKLPVALFRTGCPAYLLSMDQYGPVQPFAEPGRYPIRHWRDVLYWCAVFDTSIWKNATTSLVVLGPKGRAVLHQKDVDTPTHGSDDVPLGSGNQLNKRFLIECQRCHRRFSCDWPEPCRRCGRSAPTAYLIGRVTEDEEPPTRTPPQRTLRAKLVKRSVSTWQRS